MGTVGVIVLVTSLGGTLGWAIFATFIAAKGMKQERLIFNVITEKDRSDALEKEEFIEFYEAKLEKREALFKEDFEKIYVDNLKAKSSLEEIINTLMTDKADLEGKYADAKDRVDDLEKSIKEEYGFEPAITIKEVKMDFDTADRITLTKAMEDLIAKASDPGDLKHYIDLFERMFTVFIEANEVDAANEINEENNKRK